MQRLGKGERSADNEGAGACERVDEIARISKGRGRATRGRGERGGGGVGGATRRALHRGRSGVHARRGETLDEKDRDEARSRVVLKIRGRTRAACTRAGKSAKGRKDDGR